MVLLLLFSVLLWTKIEAYNSIRRFGHTALLVNNSIYFYGGNTTLGTSFDNSTWISDLAILPIDKPFELTEVPWQPSSGSQSNIGGPTVYSHIAFVGGHQGKNMIIVGGASAINHNHNHNNNNETSYYNTSITDNNSSNNISMGINNENNNTLVYSYDCDLGRWNTFTIPNSYLLKRQGASSTVLENGTAYIWGGKHINSNKINTTDEQQRQQLSYMYRLDSIYPSNSTIIYSPYNFIPPVRYQHTQTLVSGHLIIILGGFDGLTGRALSMTDVWIFNTTLNQWSQVTATLDNEQKLSNRSSHSQVLMPDDTSILIYGGYDGYHVFNDVAVLDTKSWTWTIKNTNAAVQGRADHTATLIGTSMIVAFGFTGILTSLTVMSDIEVLDINTWSWTSYYTPSQEYIHFENTNITNNNNNSNINNINNVTNNDNDKQNFLMSPNSSTMIIVAGTIIGSLAIFFIIAIILSIIKCRQREKIKSSSKNNSMNNNNSNHHHQSQCDSINTYLIESPQTTLSKNTLLESLTTSPTSLASPMSPFSPQLPMKSIDYNNYHHHHHLNHHPRKVSQASLPSPWEQQHYQYHYNYYQQPFINLHNNHNNHNHNKNKNMNINRAATTSGYTQFHQMNHYPHHHYLYNYQHQPISKPDEDPLNNNNNINHVVKRAATIATTNNYNYNNNENINENTNYNLTTNDYNNDVSFDRQEFILHSEELIDQKISVKSSLS